MNKIKVKNVYEKWKFNNAKNKRVLGLLFIGCFLAAPVNAKDKQAVLKPITVDDIIAKMKKQLELTDEQAIKVRPIIEEHLAREKQLMLEEKKELSRVLTGQQLYTWNFLQNEPPREKKKK